MSLMAEAGSSRKKLYSQESTGLTETSHGNLHFSSTMDTVMQVLDTTAWLVKVLHRAD